jgi:hypothetical protein
MITSRQKSESLWCPRATAIVINQGLSGPAGDDEWLRGLNVGTVADAVGGFGRVEALGCRPIGEVLFMNFTQTMLGLVLDSE